MAPLFGFGSAPLVFLDGRVRTSLAVATDPAGRFKMLRATVLFVAVMASACTILRPSGIPSAELAKVIAEGSLIRPGDRVKLVTVDKSTHEFRVERIEVADGLIVGTGEVVRIADVVAVETRQFAPGKTVALGLSLAFGVSAVVAIGTAPAAILSAAAF